MKFVVPARQMLSWQAGICFWVLRREVTLIGEWSYQQIIFEVIGWMTSQTHTFGGLFLTMSICLESNCI